jgi:hypothetical protein
MVAVCRARLERSEEMLGRKYPWGESTPLNDHHCPSTRVFGKAWSLVVYPRSTKTNATHTPTGTWRKLDNDFFSNILALAGVALRALVRAVEAQINSGYKANLTGSTGGARHLGPIVEKSGGRLQSNKRARHSMPFILARGQLHITSCAQGLGNLMRRCR